MVISILQAENLRVKDILAFARKQVAIDKYFPDLHADKLSCNFGATLVSHMNKTC